MRRKRIIGTSHVPSDQLFGNSTMFIASLVGTIAQYLRYRSQLASISNLDDRILRDIGLDRGALRSAAWEMITHGAGH